MAQGPPPLVPLPSGEEAWAEELAMGARFGPLAFSGDTIELGRKIGEGATAKVYECFRSRAPEQLLAAKVIDVRRLGFLDDAEPALRRLEVEVRALREATHERCLGLHDIYRSRKYIFLVMERLPGGELFDQISHKKRFSETEARYVFRQVCEGTAFLHSKRIVHRDIKPENVLVAGSREATPPESGTLFDVKLADYGLSKFLTDGSIAKSMVGTPQYWAPEVAAAVSGSGVYDERADLWSLGVFLYVMLRGKYPFKAGDFSGELDLTSGAWAATSADAKELIRGLLRVRPDDRLTLQAVLRHPWLTGRPMEDQPMPSSEPSALAPPSSSPTSASASRGPSGGSGGAGRSGSGGSAGSGGSGGYSGYGGGYGGGGALPVVAVAARGAWDGGAATALARWQERGRLHVGGDGNGTAFNLVELCQLQVSLAASLEMASLACRHSHPHLAVEIQLALVNAADLGQRSLKVIREYGRTAQAVKDKMLPELQLAVEQSIPSMAVDCLDTVTKWAHDMRSDSEETQSKCVEFAHQLHGLITKGQQEQVTHGPQGASPQPMLLDVDMADVPASDSRSSVNGKTKELFEGLARFANSISASDACGAENECEQRDLIDLLFLAPGVARASSQGQRHSDLTDVPSASAGRLAHEDSPDQEMPAQLVPVSTLLSQGTLPDLAHPLLRALTELRRVGEILHECVAFWMNMDGTVQELSRLKDHMQTLVKYASGNAKVKERFDQRLAEYNNFWDSLMRLCQQYCSEVEPALMRVRKLVSSLELMADRIDAGV